MRSVMSPIEKISRPNNPQLNSLNNALVAVQDIVHASGVDIPTEPFGLGGAARLGSVRVDPAVKLLQNITWRGFFNAEECRSSSVANPVLKGREVNPANAHLGKRTASPGGRPRSANSTVHGFKERTGTHELEGEPDPMEEAFNDMVNRTEDLWEDTKVPQADRKFYRESLCKGPPAGIEQCQELANYIIVLKLHRKATVAVLRAIQIREFAVSKCLDLLYAINRKASRLANNRVEQQNSRETVRDLAGTKDSITLVFQEEFVATLRDVQLATLNVIRQIQLWRRNLWRPHPFVYQKEGHGECNYMLKMVSDLSVLRLDVYMDVLKGVPLLEKDLTCIVFPDGKQGARGSSRPVRPPSTRRPAPTSGDRGVPVSVSFGGDGDVEYTYSADNSPVRGAPSSGARGTAASPELHDQDREQGQGQEQEQEQEPLYEVDYDSPLRESFFLDRDLDELRIAAKVVSEEAKLQQALSTEQRALREKKVFIPLLRMKTVGKKT